MGSKGGGGSVAAGDIIKEVNRQPIGNLLQRGAPYHGEVSDGRGQMNKQLLVLAAAFVLVCAVAPAVRSMAAAPGPPTVTVPGARAFS